MPSELRGTSAASGGGGGHDPLFVIDTTSLTKVAQISGLAVGNAVAVSQDGKKVTLHVQISNGVTLFRVTPGHPSASSTTTTNRIIKTIILLISSSGIALSPDGHYVFVTNGYQLSAIDTQNDELVNNISLRGYGKAVAIRSDGVVVVAVSDKPQVGLFELAAGA